MFVRQTRFFSLVKRVFFEIKRDALKSMILDPKSGGSAGFAILTTYPSDAGTSTLTLDLATRRQQFTVSTHQATD
jgi:hypothetical protein